jgi:hydrogenase-4 component F
MVEVVFLVPLATGTAAFFLQAKSGRPLLVITGAVHLALSLFLWLGNPEPLFPGFFALAPEGLLSLIVISLLFFLIAVYTTAYLEAAPLRAEPIFNGSMLVFLATMTMVTLADHIMVMWIAVEATTLASAPLILSHRSAASLEATWKYVLICSVGIALALLGSVLVALAMDAGGVDAPLSFSGLTAAASQLDPLWLKTGFVFVLVGYGTKMGLAPMHTWLPDAHSEAPSPASALLSGVLLNCAYLGIFKTNRIMLAAGLGDFSGTVLMAFGLASILAAATFILKQNEYKRLLAYSSIENMGIIAFGTGVGGLGTYGALICLIHHSLIKSSLFLSAGNILLGFGSRLIGTAGRMAGTMPATFAAFFSGFVGISGFPPFGIFLGELLIVLAAFKAGHFAAVGVFILCLSVVFGGFANHVIKMSFGPGADLVRPAPRGALVWPPCVLLLASLVLCFWMPDALYQTIIAAMHTASGGF